MIFIQVSRQEEIDMPLKFLKIKIIDNFFFLFLKNKFTSKLFKSFIDYNF